MPHSRILIADDHQLVAELCQKLLEWPCNRRRITLDSENRILGQPMAIVEPHGYRMLPTFGKGGMNLSKRAIAELIGTFWLVFGGCGSAVLAAAFPQLGIGFYGVALAFGLTVLTMAYAIGHISGCHLNPAVSLGLVAGKRFPASELLAYVTAQVVGGILAAGVLYVIASGKAGFDVSGGFASNGYGAHFPGGYSLLSCAVAEVVLTAFFLMIIMGATDKRAPGWLCADSHRVRVDAHSSRWNPGYESFGESGAKHCTRDLCWRMGHLTTLALLDSPAHRWCSGRIAVRRVLRVSNHRGTKARNCRFRILATPVNVS